MGAGAWGTALAAAFSARHQVTLWTREADLAQQMRVKRENMRFLPGFTLPDGLLIGNDFASSIADAELLIVATPLAGLRATLCRLREAGPVTQPPDPGVILKPSPGQEEQLVGDERTARRRDHRRP